MRELHLEWLERINDVTKVTEGAEGYVNFHTEGSGYRVVNAEDIVRVDDMAEGNG